MEVSTNSCTSHCLKRSVKILNGNSNGDAIVYDNRDQGSKVHNIRHYSRGEQWYKSSNKNGIWKAEQACIYNSTTALLRQSVEVRFTTITTTVRVLHMFASCTGEEISCAPLRLLSREMQPRGGARISNMYSMNTFKHMYREIWGTNPHPSIYVVL